MNRFLNFIPAAPKDCADGFRRAALPPDDFPKIFGMNFQLQNGHLFPINRFYLTWSE